MKKSEKLLKFILDDGSGKERQILSGIHKFYEPEDLVGKKAVAILNLPARKMMGMESNGMLLSAVKEVDGKEEFVEIKFTPLSRIVNLLIKAVIFNMLPLLIAMFFKWSSNEPLSSLYFSYISIWISVKFTT